MWGRAPDPRKSSRGRAMILLTLTLVAAAGAEERIVFTRGGDLWIMDGDGRNQRGLTRTDVREEAPNCSPDGELIAYQVYDAARRVYDVWVMEPEGQNQRTLVPDGHSPAWSPSCGRLAFVSEREGSHNIWVVTRDGQKLTQVTSTPEPEISPTWSPLGDRLAFIRLNYQKNAEGKRVGCTSGVIIREPDGRKQEILRMADVELTHVTWSRRGKFLLAGTRWGEEEESSRLWIASTTGAGLRSLTPGPAGPETEQVSESQPAWAPDGHGLAFVRQKGDMQAIWRMSEAGAKRRALTTGTDLDRAPAFLPGGEDRALRVFIRDRRVFFTPAPHLVGGEVMLPARPVCRTLGIKLGWDPATQTLELFKAPHRIRINLRHHAAKRDDQPVSLETFPRAVNGITVLPIRRLAELLNIPVRWEPQEGLLHLGA